MQDYFSKLRIGGKGHAKGAALYNDANWKPSSSQLTDSSRETRCAHGDTRSDGCAARPALRPAGQQQSHSWQPMAQHTNTPNAAPQSTLSTIKSLQLHKMPLFVDLCQSQAKAPLKKNWLWIQVTEGRRWENKYFKTWMRLIIVSQFSVWFLGKSCGLQRTSMQLETPHLGDN